jgi:hypothetical protein
MAKIRGEKGWMLRKSPHNEDVIFVVGRSEKDLAGIAESYVVELFAPLDWVESKVDLKKKQVEVWYGDHGDDEGNSTTFYITEVEIL